jgi:phosphoribosyl 1,2-cyclic phosphodiesterase
LGEWCADYQRTYPAAKNVVAQCLKHIRTNRAAIALFHAHHTLNSARLRNGLRQYIAEVEQNHKIRAMRTHLDQCEDFY